MCGVAAALMTSRHSAAIQATKRALATEHETALADLLRRSAIDVKKAEKFSISALASDLLPVADNLERAYKHATDSAAGDLSTASVDGKQLDSRVAALTEGLTLTEKSFLHAFRKHGIEKQSPLSE